MNDIKNALEGAKHYELFPAGSRELIWQLLDAYHDTSMNKPDTYGIYERIIFHLEKLLSKNAIGTVALNKSNYKKT